MTETRTGSPARDLLLRLAAGDERSLRAVLRPTLEREDREEVAAGSSLDRRTRMLVRLGALLAVDATTDSLRWAVELAAAAGAGEDAVAAVLLATGSAAGSAQLVSSAARLAVALDYESGVPEEPALCD
jgi:alkylhydroperoxidase/carboxymuconolactone decarboxylase family protein YurZ